MKVPFDPKLKWVENAIAFSRETVEVRAHNSEKSAWRRKLNLRKTKAVVGLPGAIPGQLVWSDQQHRIAFGWKSILPVPASGINVHPRDERGVYLLCPSKPCAHGGGAVQKKVFADFTKEIKADFGAHWYREDFIYGQFYRSDNGTHTFVRLLPDKVDLFDPAVIELLKARRMQKSLPFIVVALNELAGIALEKEPSKPPAETVERMRTRLLTGWRHAHAVGRAVGVNLMTDDSLPGWRQIRSQLDKGLLGDFDEVAKQLSGLSADKGDKWSLQGVHKAAAVVARTFFELQALCLRVKGDTYLKGLGIELHRPKLDAPGLTAEDYRFPVLPQARAEFGDYMAKAMKVRQLDDSAAKNADKAYADALAAILGRATSDLEVLEIFGMNLAYVSWAPGYALEVKQELEQGLWIDAPSLKGKWTMVERIAQPQDDPDYPGFVVAIWKREGSADFILTPKGTSSEDGPKCKPDARTRDQADKKNKVSTGVEADGDPSGVAYHAVKKYFKRILLEKMKGHGLSADSKVIVAGHSLGGALTQRLHLKLYEAGFRNLWSVAFSPPALDARSISKALFRDDQMGPAAFDRLVAIGGTWDVVTKGGDTGACIPLRMLCIRPWEPGSFTPVPYSVCGDNTVDQRFLQHGTMFQHECKTSGWRLYQQRTVTGFVSEDTGKTYNLYDYCKDVTKHACEITRTPWGMEKMLTADDQELAIRQQYGKAPESDAERAKMGSVSKYTTQILVLNDAAIAAFKEEGDRKSLERDLAERAKKSNAGVRVYFVKDEEELVAKLREASWANGCVLNPGTHWKSEKLRDAVKEAKLPVVEVFLGSQLGDDVIAAAAKQCVAGKGIAGYADAMDWLARNMGA